MTIKALLISAFGFLAFLSASVAQADGTVRLRAIMPSSFRIASLEGT